MSSQIQNLKSRTTKEKIKHFVILFFSLFLISAVFSQVEPKATSDVAFGSGKNLQPTDWLYYKSNNDLSAYLGKKSSNLPTVRYQKGNDYLQFSMNEAGYSKSVTDSYHLQPTTYNLTSVSSTTSPSLETKEKDPNNPILFYRNILDGVDANYQITKAPFKIKEEIVLKSIPHPIPLLKGEGVLSRRGHLLKGEGVLSNSAFGFGSASSTYQGRPGGVAFLFNAETSAKPVKQKDGSIAFFNNRGEYLFQLDKPFMVDARGIISDEVSVEIIPLASLSSEKLSSYQVKNNSQFSISNFQSIFNDPIFKPILGIFSSLKIENYKFNRNSKLEIENSKPRSYQIILSANSEWLNDPTRSYPVIIDPTVTHNADANFTGQFNRIADSDTTSSTQLESSYPEATKDPYTVLLLHFSEANGATVGITDMASSTRVITANGNASTTSAVKQLGLGNSAAFDGTGDYLSVPDSDDWNFGGGDFSIDFWVNSDLTEQSNDLIELFGQGNNDGGNNYMSIDLRSVNQSNPGKISFRVNASASAALDILSSAIAANTWNHITATKQGSTYSLFLNGKLEGTAIYATALPDYTSPVYISKRNYSNNYGYLKGYLDEFRIIKGRALTPEEIKAAASRRPYAVYTSPVIDATASVAWNTLNWTEGGVNTGLSAGAGNGEQPYSTNSLVAQWDFNDTSGTTLTASSSGSCTTACNGTLNGFAYTASQDQATTTTGWTANNKKWGAGSLMFDGTNDYVSVPDSANWYFGAGDFSINAWLKFNASTDDQMIFAQGTDSTHAQQFYMRFSTNKLTYVIDGGVIGADVLTWSWTPSLGAWYYLSLVRSGSVWTAYVNGISLGTATPTSPVGDYTGSFIIGANWNFAGNFLNGIMDSFSVYKGRALSASEILSNYNAGNIEIQTRTGATSDPNDGSWEAWKPTTGETQLLNMDSDAGNWHSDIMASTTIATSTETVIKAEGTGSLKVKMGMASTTAGAVALWHMEETGTTTGTYLYDSTSNAKNGTTNGTPTVINGIFGKARGFDGVDDYVNIGSSVTSAVDNFTLSAWFKVPSMTGAERAGMMIIQNGNNSGGYGVGFVTNDAGGYIGGIYNGIVWQTFSTNGLTGASGLYNLSPSPDIWHHIALVRNNGTTVGYMDGVQYQVYYPTTAPAAVANAAAVGKGSTNGAGAAADVYFKGSIDEPMVLNRALSPDEIAETYRMGANHHLTRQVSAVDLSAQTKLAFWIAADRPGTGLEAMLGESDYANYELASSTLALSTNTVLYIKGDEIASSTSIKDSSFSAKTITANGNARTAGGGKIGNSLYFDGTGDYLRVSAASDWKFLHGAEDTTGFKWSYDEWVSINSFASRNVLLATGYNANNARLELTIESNRNFRIELQNATESGLSVASGGIGVYPNDSNWHHIAVTYDHSLGSNNLKWYLDGVLISSANKSGTPSTGDPQHTLSIGEQAGQAWTFNGKRDELRIVRDNILTPDQIRQAYEYGLRTHPITIDFGATLQPSDLISSATDYNFSLTATTSGLSATTSGLYLGDKIIIKENLGGTEYAAQGTVNAINTATGAITVPSWDSGSTFPSGNGYSPSATVFKWQREYFDITGAATTTRNAITNLTLRPTNGAEGRTIYLDDFRYNTNYLTASSSSTITSGNNRYLQYRAIFSSTDTFVSPFLSAFNTIYTSLAQMFPSLIGVSGGGFLSF